MTARFPRPCLDCGQLAKGSRCPEHQAQFDRNLAKSKDTPERRAKKRALYGGDYQRRRRELLATATICYMCGRGVSDSSNPLEADHLIPGDPSSPLAAAHRRCNQSRGNKPIP